MGSLSETNPSIWAATAPDGPVYPTYDDPAGALVDVAVFGGGIAGLSTALALVEAGASVVVLEADRICSGVTAYTTAKVSSLHGLTYAGLISSFNEDVARAYGDANQAGIEQVATWIEKYAIDADFSRRPAYAYTTANAKVADITAEVEAAQRLGLPASFTTETELPFDVKAAVRFDNQAQFDPRRYCLGLAAAIVAGGGRIYEQSRAVDVDSGEPCTVRTRPGATLQAAQVVVATHIPFLDRGGYFAKTHPTRSYALAARLGAAATVPEGMYLGVDEPTRSVRSALGDSVVILGGEGHKVGQDDDTTQRYAALEAWAREYFDVDEIEHRWSAQDYAAVDGLPYVGRQTSGSPISVATGFRKWGMTNGTAAGMMLARELTGQDNPWAKAFDASRQATTFTSKDFYRENANVAQQMVGDRLAAITAPSADTLQAGEGGIVSLDSDKVAAFRDEDGALHAVSAACTHLGCLVAFNTAERSWDCPCHGSRFSLDGEVLQGPATKSLERKPKP